MQGFEKGGWTEDEAGDDGYAESEKHHDIDYEEYFTDCLETGEAEGGLGENHCNCTRGHGACEPVPIVIVSK